MKTLKWKIQYRLQTTRLLWRLYRWYSVSGKYWLGIGGASAARKPEKILAMPIWLSNSCNASCVFCAKGKLGLTHKMMGMALYKKVVDQAFDLGIRTVGLNPIIGEVLLDKDVSGKIRYAKEKGMKVTLFTNGMLLAKDGNYRKLVDSGIDAMSISVGDVEESLDAKIYGVTPEASRARWEGILKLLEYLKEAKAKTEIFVCFRPARPPYQITRSKPYRILKAAAGDNPNVTIEFLMCYDNWGGQVKQSDVPGIMRIKKNVKKGKGGVCVSLYNTIITPDGKARLCGCRIIKDGDDELVIGDVNISSLAEILEGPKAGEVREKFARGVYPKVCRECTLYRDSK